MSQEDSPFALPQLSLIFDALRRGRHLCPEDGKLYWALRDHLGAFLELFDHLGFRLEQHPRDFFYFRGKDSLSPQASRMAVFVFVLVESLSDQGLPVVETLMTETFSVSDLPHLKGARYRTYLKEAGAATEDDLRGIIRQLDRFGFAQRLTDDRFRFRTPAYRFFDACTEIFKQHDLPAEQEQTS
jgi:chromosome condensin MukBEF MukE localization factor